MVSLGRSNCAWLFIASIGLAAAAPKDGLQQPQHKAAAANEAHRQGGGPPPTPPICKKPAQSLSPTKSDDDNEEQPSKALAEAAAWATIVQAITSVLGLIGLFFTVLFAAKAWRQAERSADAAHKTLVQDARQSVHELRAYVFPVAAEVVSRIAPNVLLPTIKIAFENSGQTPAYDVRASATVMFASPGYEPDWFSEEDIVNAIPPGGKFTKEIRSNEALNDYEFSGISSGAVTIILFGYIKYRSFGKERATHFQYRYDGSGPEPAMVICPTGNHADEEPHY